MEMLISQGKELGLEGQALLKFISEQQALERDERKAKRDAELEKKRLEQQMAENEQKKFEVEAETEKRKVNADIEQKRLELEHERTQEKMRMDHELEMKKVQVQGNGAGNGGSNGNHSNKAKTPRLPVFVDGKDDLDAYLERFERYAKNQGWKDDEWATDLSALLTGKALGVYSRMSAKDAVQYDRLKKMSC